jgi:hypothetical protein
MRLILTTASPTNIDFLDGGSTLMGGPYTLQAGGAIILDGSGEPWFINSDGNTLEINLSAAATAQGAVWYTQS